MNQDPAKIAQTYDGIAREYTQNFRDEHAHKPMDREILGRFARELAGRGPVWDLGCGPGHTTHYLARLGLDICGLDISEKLLAQARRAYPGIAYRRGNLLDLAFEDRSIAGIVAFYAIVHFSMAQVKTALQETFRVLQPGGSLLITYHVGEEVMHLDRFLGKSVDIEFRFFTSDEIAGCLETIGFEEIQTILRDPYPEVEYQSRRAYVFSRKPYSKP